MQSTFIGSLLEDKQQNHSYLWGRNKKIGIDYNKYMDFITQMDWVIGDCWNSVEWQADKKYIVRTKIECAN